MSDSPREIKRKRIEAGRERILEIIATDGPQTVSSLSISLTKEGVYVPVSADSPKGAAIHWARARVKELEKRGLIYARPNPAQRYSDLWALR